MTESDALNLFNELDKAMNNERPRFAARKVISMIFEQIEGEYAEIVEDMNDLIASRKDEQL